MPCATQKIEVLLLVHCKSTMTLDGKGFPPIEPSIKNSLQFELTTSWNLFVQEKKN